MNPDKEVRGDYCNSRPRYEVGQLVNDLKYEVDVINFVKQSSKQLLGCKMRAGMQ